MSGGVGVEIGGWKKEEVWARFRVDGLSGGGG